MQLSSLCVPLALIEVRSLKKKGPLCLFVQHNSCGSFFQKVQIKSYS